MGGEKGRKGKREGQKTIEGGERATEKGGGKGLPGD
jgi:hypothetical protein